MQHPARRLNDGLNLINIPQLLLKGWKLSGSKEQLEVTSPDGLMLPFDIKIPTTKGCVYACCFKRVNEVNAVHADGRLETTPQAMSVNQAHAKLGHCSEALTRSAAENLGIVLKRGVMKPCTGCGMGKAQQKNITKSAETFSPGI
jgi:hypothetical protein